MSHSGTLQSHSLGKFKMSPLCNWWEHCNHVIQDAVNVLDISQAREIGGTLAGKILNGLVMYQLSTLVLAPSVSRLLGVAYCWGVPRGIVLGLVGDGIDGGRLSTSGFEAE